MSRSYRQPFATCGYGGLARRFYKNLSNRILRRNKMLELPDYGKYRIMFVNPYDVCDYKLKIEPDDEFYYRYRRK